MYAVRYSCLAAFFNQVSNGLVANQFCDMAFMNFARACRGNSGQTVYMDTTRVPANCPWMYFYNAADGSTCRASKMQRPPLQEDRELACRMLPQAIEHFPSMATSSHDDLEDKIAEIFAGMRREIMMFCASNYCCRGSSQEFAQQLLEHLELISPLRDPTNFKPDLELSLSFLSVGKPLSSVLESFGMDVDATPFERLCEVKASLLVAARDED